MSERILVIDTNEALQQSLQLLVANQGYEVVAATSAQAALQRLESKPFDLVFADARMPGIDGLELLPQIVQRQAHASIILTSAEDPEELAAETLRRGAYDYLHTPFLPSELLLTLRKARERQQLCDTRLLLERDLHRAAGDCPIVAASPLMIEILEQLERAASFKAPVLMTGERGSGKEVLARAIHAQSPRRHQPFVAVDCRSAAEAKLESELFGSPTSFSEKARHGWFFAAHQGTLFLDEVSELPESVQTRLLGLLEAEQLQPESEAKPRQVDVRVIASSARDLAADAQAGRFLPDLLERLAGLQIAAPALRERREDIPLMVDHFMARFREQLRSPVRRVSDDALEHLSAYDWPGNVRELENVIEHAMLLAEGDRLTLQALPASIITGPETKGQGSQDFSLKRVRRQAEAAMIRRALQATQANRTHAAKLLNISHRALLYKLKEYGIR